MNKRGSVRYESGKLPSSLVRVGVSWADDAMFEAMVVNCCTLGMRVTIPSVPEAVALPGKNDPLTVGIPIENLRVSGMCVYGIRERDGSVTLGIYFINPNDQNHIRTVIFSVPEPDDCCGFVSYEWEEFVTRLCNSSDPKLKEIGCREWLLLMEKENRYRARHHC